MHNHAHSHSLTVTWQAGHLETRLTDHSFYYITGVNFADCAVTYDIGKDRLTLWIPYIEPRQSLYFGSVPDAAKCMQLYDVDDVRYRKELPKFLKIKLNESNTLFLLNRQQGPRSQQFEDASSHKPRINVTSLRPAMDRARVLKDPQEIALIRKANAISSVAHRETARSFLRMRNEQEVEAIFAAACTARGSHTQSYQIIAGAGENAATLHYFENNQPLKGKELMVLDAGGEYNLYASDITRTLPISGRFSKEAGAIHDIVQDMQDACIEAVKPGIQFYRLHLLAASIALDGLIELGIFKGDRDELARSGVVSAFFPHGLGHHVGLEVHDVSGDERLLYASNGQRLEAGKREFLTQNELAEMSSQDEAGKTNVLIDRQSLESDMIVTIEPGM